MISIPFDFNPNNTTVRTGSNVVPQGRRWFVQLLRPDTMIDGVNVSTPFFMTVSVPITAGTTVTKIPIMGMTNIPSVSYQVTVAGAWSFSIHESETAVDFIPYVTVSGTGNVTGSKVYNETTPDPTFPINYAAFKTGASLKVTGAATGTLIVTISGPDQAFTMSDNDNGFWVKEGVTVSGSRYRVTEYLNAV